jgi:RNA polymerase sigma-70 factor (ECF subfamily)
MGKDHLGETETCADDGALQTLYDEHGGALLRYALHLTGGDWYRAEDLVQETMVRAWKNPRVLADGPPRAWLFTVLRNLAVDAYRARQHRPPEVSPAGLDLVPDADDSTGRVLDVWTVRAAFLALTADHRRVLTEIFYRDLSVRETAALLEIPVGTVKSRVFYALRTLQVILEEEGLSF